jgi:hypothetical protein
VIAVVTPVSPKNPPLILSCGEVRVELTEEQFLCLHWMAMLTRENPLLKLTLSGGELREADVEALSRFVASLRARFGEELTMQRAVANLGQANMNPFLGQTRLVEFIHELGLNYRRLTFKSEGEHSETLVRKGKALRNKNLVAHTLGDVAALRDVLTTLDAMLRRARESGESLVVEARDPYEWV